MFSVITVDIDPEIHLGPITLAWHGLTIAIGIYLGMLVAARWLRRREIDVDPLYTLTALLAVAAIVGSRLFYVAEEGGALLGTRGFTFDGGFIAAGIVLAMYVRLKKLDARYLDAIAFGLPLGVAVGRIGDVINGEHYGPQSTSLLAVRNAHPDALTPNAAVAFENGGLYEVLLAALIALVVLAVHRRLRHPGDLAWLVLGAFALGRFFVFFLRSDSPELALGLSNGQWTSIALLLAAIVGRAGVEVLRRRRGAVAVVR